MGEFGVSGEEELDREGQVVSGREYSNMLEELNFVETEDGGGCPRIVSIGEKLRGSGQLNLGGIGWIGSLHLPALVSNYSRLTNYITMVIARQCTSLDTWDNNRKSTSLCFILVIIPLNPPNPFHRHTTTHLPTLFSPLLPA